MKVSSPHNLFLVLCICFSSQGFSQFKGWQPNEVWNAKGKFMGRDNIALVTINPKMTLVYDLNLGGLITTWSGKIGPATPMADSGKLYFPNGPLYHNNSAEKLWKLVVDKKPVEFEIKNGHYKVEKNLLSIHFEIHAIGFSPIKIKEVPKFDDHYGHLSLFREMTIESLPKNAVLELQLHGPQAEEQWQESGGNGTIKNMETKPFLQVYRSGETIVKGVWYFK